jgi:uncharacterized membrane protein
MDAVNGWALFVAAFLACAVESIEALTIVLAAGAARREWRSAFTGAAAAFAVLAVLTAALGPALTVIPLRALRLLVGGLLLVFGLQWLRKAILRAAGVKAKHDESEIFAAELSRVRAEGLQHRGGVADWYAFTLAFKGVLLEGLEVVFIVLTFGANAHDVPLAALAAAVAVVGVILLGVAVRAPLARAPENAMKFVVGIMLTAFGVFWGAEGAGAHWPGGDAALPVVVVCVAAFALLLVRLVQSARPRVPAREAETVPA